MDEIKERMYEEYLESQLGLVITSTPVDEKEAKNTFTKVYKDGKVNWMLENGKMLSDFFYDNIFAEGYRGGQGFFVVYDKVKGYNYINQDGKLLSDKWFTQASDFCRDYDTEIVCATITDEKGKEKRITPDLKKYNENKNPNKYEYKNDFISKIRRKKNKQTVTYGTKSIRLDKHALYFFGNGRYVLCSDEYNLSTEKRINTLSVYDTVTKNYTYLSNVIKINEINHFNSNYFSNIIYLDNNAVLLYDGKMYNITNYLNNHNIQTEDGYEVLPAQTKKEFDSKGVGLSRISIKEGIKLLDATEFELLNEDKINEASKQAEIEAKRIEEENKQRLAMEQITIAHGSDEEKNRQLKEEKQQTLNDLKTIADKLSKLNNVNIDNNRISIDNIFTVVDDHQEIIDEFKSVLSNIDLTLFSFDNVNVAGLDFSNTNLNTTLFNPQKVYQRNLSGCDLTGLYFSPFSFDLSNVDIRGTSFSSNPYEENSMPNFENALYDETTTFNGVPITEILKQEKTETEGPTL